MEDKENTNVPIKEEGADVNPPVHTGTWEKNKKKVKRMINKSDREAKKAEKNVN